MALEENNTDELMLGGLGLGGAAFAAQTGRAPSPVPIRTAPQPFPTGSNLPTNPLSPSVGPSGGTGLPSNPSLATARQAATASAQRAAPTIASRALSLLGKAGLAFAGGYGAGTAAENLFDISGNIARGLFPDAPTLTREERAALGQSGAEASDTATQTNNALMGNQAPTTEFGTQYNPYGLPRAMQDDVTPMEEIGAILGGPFSPRPSALEAIQARTQSEPTTQEPTTGLTAPTAPAMGAINDVMSRAGVPTRDQLVSAIQAQAPTQAARPAMGLRTDPQGRMIPAGFETRAEAFPEYERQAAAREARLEAKPDFMEAQPVESRRTAAATGIPTDAELRDLAQARMPEASEGDIARGMKVAARYGVDPLTGKRPKVVDPELERLKKEQTQASIEASRARLAKAGLRPVADPEVDPETGMVTQLHSDGIKHYLTQLGRNDLAGLDLSSFVGDSDQEKEGKKKGKKKDKEGFSIIK